MPRKATPLFVQEVLRYLVEEGLVIREDGRYIAQAEAAQAVPDGLRDVVGRRLSHLGQKTNEVLAIASVVWRDFSLEVLQRVAGLPEEELLESLEEATERSIIEQRPSPGAVGFRFTHAFFRRVLYEEIFAPRRIRLHQQVARAMEEGYAQRLEEHAAELAEHFAQSVDPEDLTKAISYGELAAKRSLSVFAHGEAVRHLEQALRAQDVLNPDDAAKHCDLLLALGEALLSLGENERVFHEVAPVALGLAEQLRDIRRAFGVCRLAWTVGAGDANFTAILWEAAENGASRLHAFFAPWTARPDRDVAWRERESGSLPQQALLHFAPETPEDALAGDATAEYIPLAVWDLCRDDSLPPLRPADKSYLVIGVDAAVSGDYFAVVAVSRHPDRHEDPAVRACRVWRPQDYGGRINFEDPERFSRLLCQGGCTKGHPPSMPLPGCPDCETGVFPIPPHNVVQVCYDHYQLEEMMQRLRRESVTWCFDFPQGPERAIADSNLLKLALQRRLAHSGDEQLREHVGNARAKLSADEDSRLRIVKKSPGRKIDLLAAVSMAVDRALYLNI